ncbi:MAG TPA: hypothetical protein DEO70_05320 [Bacteroidales bacterium]|nr:hypothetical protein [Bacteroidales bacterium]
MPPVLLGEGKPCHQVTEKKQNYSFIAQFYQNQMTLVTLNSVILSTTTADFSLNYNNNCP